MQIINSKDNATFKKLKKLRTKKYREEYKLFLAEGRKFLDFSCEPKYIIIEEGFDYSHLESKLDKFNCDKIILSSNLFKDLSSQENSQGIILAYDFIESSLETLGDNIVILDMIGDPGNLGTIIRTMDAAGFKDILLTKGSVDIYNEKVIRSTMGSIFNMNFIYVDENELFEILESKNYNIIATALEDDSVDYNKMKLKSKNAIIFGNEGNGIRQSIIKKAHEKIIIPIYGSAESLNVGIAAGIIIYKIREMM